MKGKAAKILGGLIGALLFLSAVWVLHKTLKNYQLGDILNELKSISKQKILFALGLTFLNYLVLTGYDTLAFKYIRNPLSYFKIAYASFIGYAFSLNMGYALISGGSARYRLYSSWHLPKTDIAKVIAFCTFTFWLGFFSLGGVIFLVSPPPLPPSWHLPLDSIQILGAGFLLLIGLYLFWGLLKRKTFKIRKWAFSPPQRPILIGQVLLSALDWALAATVFYVLLPPDSGVSYLTILSVLLLAQLTSLASQVPAGLGVLESVVILFLGHLIPAPTLFGVLVAYRAIYFLLPFCVAILMLLLHEIRTRKSPPLARQGEKNV